MAYCHECGSELGEAEGFCPYCGITLKPLAVNQEQEKENEFVHEVVDENTELKEEQALENSESDVDLSMSETVMVNPDDFKVDNVKSDSVSPQVISEKFESDTENVVAEPETPADAANEQENLNKRKLTDEVNLEQINQKGSAVQIIPENDFSSDKKEEILENNQPSKDSLSDNLTLESSFENTSETSADKESEISAVVVVEKEVESNESDFAEPSDVKIETLSENVKNSEIANDSGFDATIPYIPPKVKDKTEEDSVRPDEEIGSTADDLLEIDESESPESVSNKGIENKIVSPVENEPDKDFSAKVEQQESVKDQTPTFKKPKDDFKQPIFNKEAEAITMIQGSKELVPPKPSESPQKQDQANNEEVISSTTPNINATDTGGKSAKLKPLDEGTVLNGRYEIVRKIGGGGMGAVYLASDKNLGGVLRAVKEMVQSYIEEEQQDKAIKDFKRESMLLTSLEHTSIPTIYDYFYDEGEARFYLVMKYISGGDLSARLKAAPEGRLDEKSVVEWGIQIADVLRYLHNRQPPIVYRDLKPANIMIDGNSDRVMLIDFGIARWINKEEKGVTAVGTMGYAPPELFSGNVEARSDVYSLGSTMFHLMTGADPQSNPLLIFDFQKHPRPRQINPNLSDQIEKILMRSVEYSANKRFESAEKMRDALIKHLEHLNQGRVTYGITQTPKSVGLEEQPVFCGFCGQKIVASDMFCAFCGAKQPLASPGVHSEEYVHLNQTARLVIAGTSELDSPSFTLEKTENLVGRRDPLSNIFPEVDLSKYDPQTKISRKHARICRDGDHYLVEDLGSSNGTFLISTTKDNFRLEPNKAQMLNDGDKIKVGDTTLQFVVQ